MHERGMHTDAKTGDSGGRDVWFILMEKERVHALTHSYP